MNIIHGPVEIAGQVGITARAQRALGYNSVSIVHTKNIFNYDNDHYIYNKSDSKLVKNAKMFFFLKDYLSNYDIYHFHYAEPFYRYKSFYFDTQFLKRMKKKLFVEFWGSDIRLPIIEKQRNPFFVNSYNENDHINREKMKRWAEITDGKVIMSDHYFNVFLNDYFDDIKIVGQRVETENIIPYFPDPNNKNPLIVHAPSEQAFKGTKFVQEAMVNLRNKKIPFEYKEITNMPHAQAMIEYSKADIIVDQLCAGAHGIFACEAMALGKPVICYILPELLSGYPQGFPIINANPNTIEKVLEELIQRHEDRYSIGRKSRAYVERVHDSKVVAKKLIDIYQS